MESLVCLPIISETGIVMGMEDKIVDPVQYEAELKKTLKAKIGIDNEEMMEGLIGLAVPIFSREKKIIATVAIHATTVRTNAKDVMKFIPALRRAASALEDTFDADVQPTKKKEMRNRDGLNTRTKYHAAASDYSSHRPS
jgi:DNA-binding IclR family transcriptional regulator